ARATPDAGTVMERDDWTLVKSVLIPMFLMNDIALGSQRSSSNSSLGRQRRTTPARPRPEVRLLVWQRLEVFTLSILLLIIDDTKRTPRYDSTWAASASRGDEPRPARLANKRWENANT